MFDPTRVAKLTITSPDGTRHEMEGHVVSMNVTSDHGINTGAAVEFIASGPISLEPVGAAPSKEIVRIDGGPPDVERWGMTDPPVKLPPPDECRVCGQSVATCGCTEWGGSIPSSDDSIIMPDWKLLPNVPYRYFYCCGLVMFLDDRRSEYKCHVCGRTLDAVAAQRDFKAIEPPSETLTEREERLREPGGPVSELMESGEGDTLDRASNCASRMFMVRLDDVFTQDPLRVLQGVVRFGDAHPRSPEIYAVRFVAEERLTKVAFRCRVEYEIGRWEWYKRGGARWMDQDKYDREVRGVVPRPSLVEPLERRHGGLIDDVPTSWPWEAWSPDTWLFAWMIPVAAVTRLVLGWIL